jgi:hypothetical protein
MEALPPILKVRTGGANKPPRPLYPYHARRPPSSSATTTTATRSGKQPQKTPPPPPPTRQQTRLVSIAQQDDDLMGMPLRSTVLPPPRYQALSSQRPAATRRRSSSVSSFMGPRRQSIASPSQQQVGQMLLSFGDNPIQRPASSSPSSPLLSNRPRLPSVSSFIDQYKGARRQSAAPQRPSQRQVRQLLQSFGDDPI